MSKYVPSISVVEKFRNNTIEAIRLFEEEVINKSYAADQADFILSTCHGAKGLEWDNVQICDDFTDAIRKVERNCPPSAETRRMGDGSPARKKSGRPTWQFAIARFTDDLNLLYVACTRARKVLAVPESLSGLLHDCLQTI